MITNIVVVRFKGRHCWPGGPPHLARMHDHIFKVVVEVRVEAGRQIDFLQLRDQVREWLQRTFPDGDLDGISCESLAFMIGDMLRHEYGHNVLRVEVWEDEENAGAAVYFGGRS